MWMKQIAKGNKDKQEICNKEIMENYKKEVHWSQVITTVTMKVNVFWDTFQSGRYLPTFRRALLSPSIGIYGVSTSEPRIQ
jgi:hypothetical protein